MKFLAVALDYDGTIATGNVLNAEVRAAIAELRSQNIVVIIVTGRILAELSQVAGDLHFVDAVVAENGASIYFPDSEYSKLLASPAPQNLLQALRLQGIDCKAGESVLEADAKEATRILSTLQRLELPLVLVFNRQRVMVLPQATSKATGLKEVLTVLRLSSHNAVAIGDAENDHELLRSCEYGVAVAWGSKALQAAADFVLEGTGPAAVAGFLRKLATEQQIPVGAKTRRTLRLGHTDSGEVFSLAVRHRKMLIAGDTKSGKSWVTGLLCEQLILYGYSLLIIDPEGDYVSLEALPGVIVYGGPDPLPRPRDLIRALRHADVTIIIDLSHTEQRDRLEYVHNLLCSLDVLREHTGLPHCIVLDEAHYFLHNQHDEQKLLNLQLDFSILVSYRASWLHASILRDAETILITRESDPREIYTLRSLCAGCERKRTLDEWITSFGNLKLGEAIALPVATESGGDAATARIHLAPRLTPHVRHVAKYVDLPVCEKEQFFFFDGAGPSGQYARTLRELVFILDGGDPRSFESHLRQHDFSRWIADVFGDYPLANTAHAAEDRTEKNGPAQSLRDLTDAIRARYDLHDPLHGLKMSLR